MKRDVEWDDCIIKWWYSKKTNRLNKTRRSYKENEVGAGVIKRARRRGGREWQKKAWCLQSGLNTRPLHDRHTSETLYHWAMQASVCCHSLPESQPSPASRIHSTLFIFIFIFFSALFFIYFIYPLEVLSVRLNPFWASFYPPRFSFSSSVSKSCIEYSPHPSFVPGDSFKFQAPSPPLPYIQRLTARVLRE